jgi:mono/diheme cytochrome c family protein
VRELGSGRSRLETAASLRINFEIAPTIPFEDGIHYRLDCRGWYKDAGRRWEINLVTRRTSRSAARLAIGLSLALTGATCGASRSPSVGVADVMPVNGSSWLTHLGLSFDTSVLGRVGGTHAAAQTNRREPMPRAPTRAEGIAGWMRRLYRPAQTLADSNEPFALTGADLYRLTCQSCHGSRGLGAPPEISSLLGPVEGTSATLLTRRLTAQGRPVDDAFVQDVVAGAEHDLVQRLGEGGKEMPPFKYLKDQERRVLINYLKVLAGVPEAAPSPVLVTEPAVRVGEHLVKGTCHVCHDATGGPRGRTAVIMSRAIPSFETLGRDYPVEVVIAKVRDGSARMPQFPYLTPEEIAAAVVYLGAYAPTP